MTNKTVGIKLAALAFLAMAGISAMPTEASAQAMTFTCVVSNGARAFRGTAVAPRPAARPAARTRALLNARSACGQATRAGNYCVAAGCRPY
jgi:hypothetical protein